MSTVETASTSKKKSKKTDMENESENQENISVKAEGKTAKTAKSRSKASESKAKTSKPSKSRAVKTSEKGIIETPEIIISAGSPTITVSSEKSSGKANENEEAGELSEEKQNEMNENPENEINEIPENEINEIPENEINEIPENEINEISENEINENPENEINENPENEINEIPENVMNEIPKEEQNENSDGNNSPGQSEFGEQPMNQTQIPMQVHSNVVQAGGVIQASHPSPEQIQEAMKRAKSQEIRIHISKSENFKQTYAIGALGVHNIYDFRMSFYNDTPDLPTDPMIRNIQRVIESEVIMSPVAAMELYRWLGQSLAEYEARFGKIKKLQELSPAMPMQNPNQMLAATSGNSGDSVENNETEKNKRRHDFMDGYA